METTKVKVNGVEITPNLAKFISERSCGSLEAHADSLNNAIGYLIDQLAETGMNDPIEPEIKVLLLDLKGVKDDMTTLAKIVSELEIEKLN